MILCDTNILIEFYKGNSQIVQELRKIGSTNIVVSVVTQAELYYGALDKAELRQITKHLENVQIYSFDTTISAQFVQLMEAHSLSHKLSIPDALIAATSLVYNVELYTLNTRDFRFIPGLRFYRP